MYKAPDDIKNGCKEQMKIFSDKCKTLRPIANPTTSKPDTGKKKAKILPQNSKFTEETVRDIRHINGTDLISKSTTVLTEITSRQKLKKEDSEKSKYKDLETNLSHKVLDGLMERLIEMRTKHEESLETVKSLGELMKEISIDFKSLSSSMNDNVYYLQHNTIQKFHALETREKKMFKKYHIIVYMVKKFGDELEKTRKSFNIMRSKQ